MGVSSEFHQYTMPGREWAGVRPAVVLSLDDHADYLLLSFNRKCYSSSNNRALRAPWLMVAIEINTPIHTSHTFFLRTEHNPSMPKVTFSVQSSSSFSMNPVDRHSLADRRVYLAVILVMRTKIKKSFNILVK